MSWHDGDAILSPMQTNKRTDTHIHRQTDRQTDRQTGRDAYAHAHTHTHLELDSDGSAFPDLLGGTRALDNPLLRQGILICIVTGTWVLARYMNLRYDVDHV